MIILKVHEKGASKNTRSIDIAPHGKQKERAKATHCPNQAEILKDLEKKQSAPTHLLTGIPKLVAAIQTKPR